MAIQAGACKHDPTSGLSKRIFDYLVADPESGMVANAFVDGTAARNALGALIEAVAKGVRDEIVANAAATVTVNVGALQRTPNPNNPDTDTQAPAVPVNLTGTVT